MANPEHVEIVKQGAEAIAAWRRENPKGRLELGEAKLREADLSGANLSRAILSGAILRGADLRAATGLTQKQVDSARGDSNTKLPEGEGLTRPTHGRVVKPKEKTD